MGKERVVETGEMSPLEKASQEREVWIDLSRTRRGGGDERERGTRGGEGIGGGGESGRVKRDMSETALT
jgi:hypothetical protein